MKNPLNLDNAQEIQRRLIEEAGGSFSLVHRALTQLSKEKKTRHLKTDDVIKRIRELMDKKEKISA